MSSGRAPQDKSIEDGRVRSLENRVKKGLSFYFVDSSNRRRSSTWVIKTDVRKRDGAVSVYAFARALGGKFKLSLHADLGCQWGMVGDFAERMKSERAGTFAPFHWKRRATPNKGVVRVASLCFPADFMRADFSGYEEKKKAIFAFEMAPAGKAVNFGIFYSRGQPEALEQKFLDQGVTPMFYSDLNNGEYVTIAYQVQPNYFELPAVFNGIAKIGKEIEPVIRPGTNMENSSAVFVLERPVDGGAIELVAANGFTVAKPVANAQSGQSGRLPW